MKTLLTIAIALSSLNSFALEGCEVVVRKGNVSARPEPQTAKRFPLSKCSWMLSKTLTSGDWDVGAAIHVNQDEETTFLKLEKVDREEFRKVRNGN